MKYVVEVGGELVDVTLDGDGVHLDGRLVPAQLTPVDGTPVRVLAVGDAVYRVQVRRGESRGRYTLWIDGWRFEVEALDERTRTIRELSAKSGGPARPTPLKAPMPGLIVRVLVGPGDTVEAGQGLIVMEAMKMENELRAPAAGTVKVVAVQQGAAVEKGALLVDFT